MKVGEEIWNENGIRGCVGLERIDRDLSLAERGNAEFCFTAELWYVCMLSLLWREEELGKNFWESADMDEYVDIMQGR